MNAPHPYDVVIGLDRSDAKADLHLINLHTGQHRSQTVDTSPEALCQWLLELRQQHPQARVALCLEQPAVHLVPFLEAYAWLTLYPINPLTLQKYREAFVTSRAKDDSKDAYYLAELLLSHHEQLKPWAPEDSLTRALQQLVVHRRAVVDERTALTNRLQALLKQYFPQALNLCGEDAGTAPAGQPGFATPTLRVGDPPAAIQRRGAGDQAERGHLSHSPSLSVRQVPASEFP